MTKIRPPYNKMMIDKKRCKECRQIKPLNEFQENRHKAPMIYYASKCKPCAAEHNRKYLYGVTLAEMIAKQGTSSCPLCQKNLAVCVDHDHATEEPRGALCQPCNRVLHYIENQGWMERAMMYLNKS